MTKDKLTHLGSKLAIEQNSFTGIANVTGVIDRGGDVIQPGAFASAIGGFLRHGFVSLAHDWDTLPVAMPNAAEERDGGLWVQATFHSTAVAQAARSVVQERLAAGLEVGLSIGFRAEPSDCLGFRTGAEMVIHAQRQGLAGLDEAGIARWRAPCRLLRRVAELFEVSIVAVPMNAGSRVVDAKRLKVELERFRLVRSRLALRR